MKKYLEVSHIFIKTRLIWRADLFFGFISIVMKIIFAVILWGTIFKNKTMVAGYTLDDMLTYYLLSSFFTQIEMSGEISQEISRGIRNGTFSKYLTNPMDTDKYFLAMEGGTILPHIALDMAAVILLSHTFGIRLNLTTDIVLIGYGILIAILGLLFMTQLSYFLGILTFRFEEISTFLMIKDNLLSLVTGAIIPLSLFPEIVVKIMQVLPFYYTAYLPSMLLSGKNGDEAFRGVLIMAAWNIGMKIVSDMVFEKYRIKYDGAGI